MTIETALDIRRFPFDKQRVVLIVMPFVQHDNSLQLIAVPNQQGIADNAHLASWNMLGYNVEIRSNKKGRSQYVFTFDYERQPTYYISKVFLPTLLLVMISWSVFWMRKQPLVNIVGFLLTTLLTIVAFQWLVLNTTPRISYLTLFDSISLFSYCSIGLSILAILIAHDLSPSHSKRAHDILKFAAPLFYIIGVILIGVVFLI